MRSVTLDVFWFSLTLTLRFILKSLSYYWEHPPHHHPHTCRSWSDLYERQVAVLDFRIKWGSIMKVSGDYVFQGRVRDAPRALSLCLLCARQETKHWGHSSHHRLSFLLPSEGGTKWCRCYNRKRMERWGRGWQLNNRGSDVDEVRWLRRRIGAGQASVRKWI